MSLEIREETIEATRVLSLNGRLDTETASDLELAVQDLLQAGCSKFVLDLSGVGYVSSAGLRVLLMLAKSVDGKGSLGLAGLNASVRQVFDVAGFAPLFSIFADRTAAVGSSISVPEDSVDDGRAAKVLRALGGVDAKRETQKLAPERLARIAASLGVQVAR